MSATISSNVAAAHFVSAFRRRSSGQDERSKGRYFPLARQLVVISEMLETMNTLTIAGQQHTMSKVVGFVEDQMAHAGLAMSERNQGMLAELLLHLTHESQRRSPDVHVFTRRAESLVALLNAVA